MCALKEPGIERVQANRHVLADTSRSPLSPLCIDCQYARRYVVTATKLGHLLQIYPIAHIGQPLPFPKLHRGTCSSMGMRPRTDTHTETDTQMRVIASSTPHGKCNRLKSFALMCNNNRFNLV